MPEPSPFSQDARAAAHSPAQTAEKRLRWCWMAPYVAVTVFALSMLLIAWVWANRAVEAPRDALARDVQWAEQTVRLHMQNTEELLLQLARDLSVGTLDPGGFQARAGQHIAHSGELIQILWVGDDARVRWQAPIESVDGALPATLLPDQRVTYGMARESARPAYGLPYVDRQGAPLLDLYVPVRRNGQFIGALAAVYSIERMVRYLVPGWFGEKYRLMLIGPTGKVLASNSGLDAPGGGLVVDVPLEPPGNGLVLRATALRGAGPMPEILPVLLIAGLSLLVVWSLWMLRLHVLRRVQVEKERDRLFNLSLDLLAVLSIDGTFKRCNPAFERVMGHPPGHFPGRGLLDFVHRDDLADAVEELRQLAAGRMASFESRCRCADGGYKWLMWSANPVPEERLIYAVAHDITGRKEAEDALRAESAFRRAMEESVVTGLRAIDLTGRIIYVNGAFCRMIGFAREELIGAAPPFPYWPPDSFELCQRNLEMTLSGQAPPAGFEMRIRRKSGELVDARFYLSPLIDMSGRHTGWMASVTDITEPKRVRAALEATQQRFEAVLDGLDAAVFVADARTDEILFANRAFKAIHGFDSIGRTVRGVAVPQPERGDYRVDPRRLAPADVPRELFDGELRHPLSGRWYHVREQATRWVDGRVVRMGIATDVTERKHMYEVSRQQEERLQRTSRLITMGEMASTLAHELNQPLSAIANYCTGCVTRIASGQWREAELLAAMEKASAQAERAGKIIRRIREFVKKSEPRRMAADLVEIVDDALGFAEIDARKLGVRIERELADALPPVHADRIMVEQVLLNLVKNGIEAMHDMPEERRLLRVRARPVEAGRTVEVSVIDRGHGIDEAESAHLFSPFYTTKPEGMGMGLNICRSIVEYHDGRLWMVPHPQGGTIFSFTLPTETASEPTPSGD